MKSFPFSIIVASALTLSLACCTTSPSDGDYQFDILATNDVHGCWFDSTGTGGATRPSLVSVSQYVNEYRDSLGSENVILLDAGDCLQGDNAAYYYNYVDTKSVHLFSRICGYMKYDAVVAGNHDIETGHPVYDKVKKEFSEMDIPYLGGNAFTTDKEGMDGKAGKIGEKRYFGTYTILHRHGLKIAVLGYTNPNISAWLDKSLWSGIEFKSLIPLVQEDVNNVLSEEKPHAVIVAIHSGTGAGDGKSYESQGLDLLNSLKGVDFIFCAHDHSAKIISKDGTCLINSGSHARTIGHGSLNISIKDGKMFSKSMAGELIKVDKTKIDEKMKDIFRKDYEAVKAFSVREVGTLESNLLTREAFTGMSPYMNLLHTVSLSVEGAQISFAAPLSANKTIKAGTLIYNDLFTIYPYENQLFLVAMTGREIKAYLEYSYDAWINTWDGNSAGHILKINAGEDKRSGQKRWHFANRSYNFDSAGGLNYTVDVTKPKGERINISSLANGDPFDTEATYNVAMTSYRASGGGGIIIKGAGISPEDTDSRITGRFPEIRELIYEHIKKNGGINIQDISNPSVIGHWEFVPESSSTVLNRDLNLLFGQ